jgi:gliding-associated putative ABC transporter substrate-binding component GldG
MKGIQKIFASKYWWFLLLVVLFAINYLASVVHARFDLTKEKRYTLSKATKELLKNLDDEVHIDVFLKGQFPAGFKKLAISVGEFLQECKEFSRGKIRIRFTNPLEDLDDSTAAYVMDSLRYFYNIPAYTIQAPGKAGDEMKQKLVLPGAVIRYKDTTFGVNLLKGLKTYGTQEEEMAKLYNDVEGTLEYKFASVLEKITSKKRPLIGYALGHGEGWGYNVDDAVKTLIKEYKFDTVNIKTDLYIPSDFDALIILKPTISFTDNDKLKIDQYVMRGGKVFWMIDNMYAEFDSLYKSGGFTAYDRGLNLEDILFRYGARINQNLLQDIQCDKLPQISGTQENGQQQRLVDWPFFPILNGTNNPISKNLDGVRAIFPNTLDTIQVAGIKKTFLLRSSSNARVLPAPAIVDFEFLQIAPDINQFIVHDTAVAVLLEGKFTSLFKNRITKTQIDNLNSMGLPFKSSSEKETKMIVVADGDIATNQVSQLSGPLPMGANLFTKYTFANKEFFTNSLEYMVNPSGILATRAKSFTLRLLDRVKVDKQKTTWQLINIAAPLLLVLLLAIVYQQVRKNKYAV